MVMGKTEISAQEEHHSKIAIYGYAGDAPISETYENEATELGKYFSEHHIIPISGCLSGHGNLHKVIESCMKNNGLVEGVVNKASLFGDDHTINGPKSYVDNYSQLKKNMFLKAQAFVVLPSGIGGLGAALDILLLKKIGAHNKPIYFYNEKFWQPILKNLEEMVGPLPEYQIINHGSEMKDLGKLISNTDQPIAEQFFDQQNNAHHDTSLSSSNSLKEQKITLKILNTIVEEWVARMEGIHHKNISLSKSDLPSHDDSIKLKNSHWEPLKGILDHMHEHGFIKEEQLGMLEFKS